MSQEKGSFMLKDKLGFSAYDLEKLGLGSRNHIYRLIKQGKIPHVSLGHRQVVPRWWVEKFFDDPSVQNLEDTSSEDEVLNRAS